MASDSSAVDEALVSKLINDSALMAILPDGAFFDVAPQSDTGTSTSKFLILSAQTHEDVGMQADQTAYETFTYLVKAVTAGPSGADVKAAAARIQTLLDHGTLTITGYTLMSMRRIERIRYTELDEDKDLRWQHRGGVYELWVSPT